MRDVVVAVPGVEVERPVERHDTVARMPERAGEVVRGKIAKEKDPPGV